jgi:hypothetical protein
MWQKSKESQPDTPGATMKGNLASSAGQRTARPQVRVNVRDDGSVPIYINFCRMNATPEEVLIDFGINAQPGAGSQDVVLTSRVGLNYYTAKRLWMALGAIVHRHEHQFGVLETDVQRRTAQQPSRQD